MLYQSVLRQLQGKKLQQITTRAFYNLSTQTTELQITIVGNSVM